MAQHMTGAIRDYTIYTIEDVPFGHFPAYADGGPAMVTNGGWNVSITTSDAAPGADPPVHPG